MAETEVKKLKRSALLHYLDPAFNIKGSGTPAWFLIGKDVEDMSVSLNPNVTQKTNILDQTTAEDEGYEPSFDVDTYYADPSDGAFYNKIKDIAMNRLVGDDCKTRVLEVLIDKAGGSYDAWIEDVLVKPKEYGGKTGGVAIPYSVTFCGNRKKGTVTIENKIPTFVPETAGE